MKLNINKIFTFCIFSLALLTLSCNKEKKKEEMITFYKSQWRDPLVVGDYIADSSFIDGRKIYHCRDFKGDGEMLIYATDTNFQVVASSPIAYWYTLDKIDGINIYMPDVDRNMENEIRGKYSFSHSSTAEYLTIINYSREVLMTLKRK